MNPNTNDDLKELVECESKITTYTNALINASPSTRAEIEIELASLRFRKTQLKAEVIQS